jgi:aldose 1-epimerase
MLRLAHQKYQLELAPQFGGAILSLKFDGLNIFREAQLGEVERSPEASACFPCVPYFGRLYDGMLLDGSRVQLSPTVPSSRLPLHGEGWISPWRCVLQSSTRATIRLDHDGLQAGRYPFSFRSEQSFSLNEQGLEIVLSVSNRDNRPMPCGLGLHPFFSRTADSTVKFNAKQEWCLPNGTTGGRLRKLQSDLGAGAPSELPSSDADLSFTGFKGDALIETRDLDIHLSSDAPLLHLYAPQSKDFFCLETITHAPGLLMEEHCSLSGKMLEPGEMTSVKMCISAQVPDFR